MLHYMFFSCSMKDRDTTKNTTSKCFPSCCNLYHGFYVVLAVVLLVKFAYYEYTVVALHGNLGIKVPPLFYDYFQNFPKSVSIRSIWYFMCAAEFYNISIYIYNITFILYWHRAHCKHLLLKHFVWKRRIQEIPIRKYLEGCKKYS